MLNIYYGNETINREKFIFDKIRADRNPEMTIMIVPDQFSLQAEQNALKSLGRRGLMDFMVADFTSLGHKVVQAAGIKAPELIDKYGRHMLLSVIIDRLSDDLSVYKGYGGRNSFTSMTNQLISEMKRYGVEPGVLQEKSSDESLGNTYLKHKLADIEKIFGAYEEAIEDKYLDSEDYIRFYGKLMESSDLIKDADIWIYGFDTFTPLNFEIIERILKAAACVNVVMTCEDKPSRDGRVLTIGEGNGLFDLPRFVIERLKETGEAAGSQVTIEAIPDQPELHRKSIWDMDELPVTLAQTTNVYTEAERLAAWIIGLVRDEGYRYGDITVICNDMECRGGIIGRTLEKYGIPVFTDRKRGVLHQPVIHFIMALCDIAAGRGGSKSVMMLVKSGLLGWSREDESLFENYVSEFNIRFGNWNKPFTRTGDKYTDEELERLNNGREEIAQIVLSAKDDIGRRNTVADKIQGLYDYLEKSFDIREKIKEIMQAQEEMGFADAAAETAQSWNMICGLLSQINQIMGHEKISNAKLRDIIKAGLEEMEIGIVPGGNDLVIVGTMQRTRVSRTRVLAVTGANEGVIPMLRSDKGILTERELGVLEDLKLSIAKREEVSRQEEQMAIYRMMSLPEEKLYVSCSLADQNGKGTVASSLFTALADHAPGAEILGDPSDEDLDMITNSKGTVSYVAGAMRRYVDGEMEPDADLANVLNWYINNDKAAIDKVVKGLSFTGQAEALEADLADALFRNNRDRLYVSASRLEQYSGCPFAHFINYGLNADEQRLFEVDARDIGDAYHQCLMEFSRSLTPADGDLTGSGKDAWMSITREECDQKVREILTAEADRYREGLFSGSNMSKFRMECIEEICSDVAWALADQVKHGKIKTMKFEEPFGKNGDLEVELDNGRKACIRGKIDRVEYIGDDRAVRVVDYKTGRNKIDMDHIRAGYKLQLMLYMIAAKNAQDLRPAGVFYMHINNDGTDYSGKAEPTPEDAEKSYKSNFKLEGILNDDVTLVEQMDTGLAGVSAKGESAKSEILPVSFVKKDGCYKTTSGSVALTELEFDELCQLTTENITKLCNGISAGNIDVKPKRESKASGRDGRRSACSFCNYKSICMFDTGLGCRYEDV